MMMMMVMMVVMVMMMLTTTIMITMILAIVAKEKKHRSQKHGHPRSPPARERAEVRKGMDIGREAQSLALGREARPQARS